MCEKVCPIFIYLSGVGDICALKVSAATKPVPYAFSIEKLVYTRAPGKSNLHRLYTSILLLFFYYLSILSYLNNYIRVVVSLWP